MVLTLISGSAGLVSDPSTTGPVGTGERAEGGTRGLCGPFRAQETPPREDGCSGRKGWL